MLNVASNNNRSIQNLTLSVVVLISSWIFGFNTRFLFIYLTNMKFQLLIFSILIRIIILKIEMCETQHVERKRKMSTNNNSRTLWIKNHSLLDQKLKQMASKLCAPFEYRSGFQMASEIRTGIQMAFENRTFFYRPDIWISDHSKSGHLKVRYSDESGIRVSGFQMVTVHHTIVF